MRQVPHYLLIGNGRLARHLQHYLSLLSLPFSTWHRSDPQEKLHAHLASATHILLLISDHAIDTFMTEQLSATSAYCIHFSGSLASERAFGAHPLMTFGEQLYDLKHYQAIPFILDDDAPAFADLLPGFSNQHVRLAKSLKAKYHALCVLSGNFSCLLWQKLFTDFEREFNFPASLAFPYLAQQTENLIQHHEKALTGPLVRRDQATLEKNIQALHADPFQEVYQSFVSCYQKLVCLHERNCHSEMNPEMNPEKNCHPERSEGSSSKQHEILRYAQDDSSFQDDSSSQDDNCEKRTAG